MAARTLRARRGVGLVFFCLIILPLLLVSLGLSVDVTRMLVARHHAIITAEAIAHAGALQYDELSFTIDEPKARTVMTQTWNESVGGIPKSTIPLAGTPNVEYATTPTSTAVTIRYNLTNLVVMWLFASKEQDRYQGFQFQVVGEAVLCEPGVSQFTYQGTCRIPR
jgi:Flp pilus assembly protein TadG